MAIPNLKKKQDEESYVHAVLPKDNKEITKTLKVPYTIQTNKLTPTKSVDFPSECKRIPLKTHTKFT